MGFAILLSGNIRPRSSQLTKPQWTDPGMKSGISVCKLIYTAKKKSAGGEGMVEHSAKILVISLLVSWYFEPSQPQRITSGLNQSPKQSHAEDH